MFDDRLFDVIMGEMMKEFGPEVRTDESSLAYNACARIAQKLEEVYGDMAIIEENMLPDTMELDYLVRYGSERGITYHDATAPVVKAVFRQEIEIGTAFICGDYTYNVTSLIDGFAYRLQCETAGTDANTTVGELTPVDYVENYLGGEITEVLVLGTDDEDVEEYRKRVIDSFGSVAFGGNRADYRLFTDTLTGVGGCKPKRRASDSAWIDIYLINSEYGVPSAGLVNDVQSALDPEQNHGEGEGMAPICHNVQVIPVSGATCDISATITLDDGYTIESVSAGITAAISDYLLSLRKSWENADLNSLVVRIAQIEARMLTVEGVLDAQGVTLNTSSDNLTLAYDKVPLLGEVVLSV